MNIRTTLAPTVLSLLVNFTLGGTALAAPLALPETEVLDQGPVVVEALTLPEAAALLRLDTASVERLAQARMIPARQIESEWRFSRSALIAWLAGDWTIHTLSANVRDTAVSSESTPFRGVALSPQIAMTTVGRGAFNAQSTSTATSVTASPAIGVAPSQRTANEVFLRDQQVLLEPGEVTLDFGLLYIRRDRQVLAGSNGGTVLANAQSESFQTQLTGRYSLHQDTEIFASTSYLQQKANLFAGEDLLSSAGRSGLGDIGIGVRRTVLREGVGRPDVVVTLDARIPTRDTSPALGTAITLVKSVDPAVLFGTLGYRHTFSRNFSDTNRLEPRHRFDLTLGLAVAINDTLSFNSALATTFNRATTLGATRLLQTTATALQLGMTTRVARGVYLQPFTSFRLSGPGTGFSLGLNIPVTF